MIKTRLRSLRDIWLSWTDPLEKIPAKVEDVPQHFRDHETMGEMLADTPKIGYYRSNPSKWGFLDKDGHLPPNSEKVTKVDWRGRLINRLDGSVIIEDWNRAQASINTEIEAGYRRQHFQVLPGGLDNKR